MADDGAKNTTSLESQKPSEAQLFAMLEAMAPGDAQFLLREAIRSTEERYRDLIEQVGAIFWEAEIETSRFIFVSRGAEQILGYPPERWLADPEFWLSRVHPDD